MSIATSDYWTLGMVADELGAQLHRVQAVVSADFPNLKKAGKLRLVETDQIPAIRERLIARGYLKGPMTA